MHVHERGQDFTMLPDSRSDMHSQVSGQTARSQLHGHWQCVDRHDAGSPPTSKHMNGKLPRLQHVRCSSQRSSRQYKNMQVTYNALHMTARINFTQQ
jgi:hypothetical protein